MDGHGNNFKNVISIEDGLVNGLLYETWALSRMVIKNIWNGYEVIKP